jgi:hypothetical protein
MDSAIDTATPVTAGRSVTDARIPMIVPLRAGLQVNCHWQVSSRRGLGRVLSGDQAGQQCLGGVAGPVAPDDAEP